MTEQQLKLAMTKRKLNKIENDLVVEMTIINSLLPLDKRNELQMLLAKEEVIQKESDLHRSAVTLLGLALENELYEVCASLNSTILSLNRNAK